MSTRSWERGKDRQVELCASEVSWTEWTIYVRTELVSTGTIWPPLLFFLRFPSSLQFIDDFESGACLLSRLIRAAPSSHLTVTWSHACHNTAVAEQNARFLSFCFTMCEAHVQIHLILSSTYRSRVVTRPLSIILRFSLFLLCLFSRVGHFVLGIHQVFIFVYQCRDGGGSVLSVLFMFCICPCRFDSVCVTIQSLFCGC